MNTRHHLFHPANAYKDEIGRMFRNLPCFIIRMDIRVHALLHEFGFSPRRPSRDEMLLFINRYLNGECDCVHHEKRGWRDG